MDPGVARADAVRLAEQRQAYVIWGALPFLKFKDKNRSAMEILVSADPILQRVMASVIVNPDKVEGVNVKARKRCRNTCSPPEPKQELRPTGRREATRNCGGPPDGTTERAQVWVFDTGPPERCSRSGASHPILGPMPQRHSGGPRRSCA